jgi:hypothetical protein
MDEAKGAVHVGQFEYAGERSHILEADILSTVVNAAYQMTAK